MKCPNCRSKELGKIGVNQFYCWDCFIELTVQGSTCSIYQVEEDGSLSSLDDLFPDIVLEEDYSRSSENTG